MQKALEAAYEAAEHMEVPVGAVVISPQGHIISVARNRTEADNDASAHAEILAMRRATQKLGSPRLVGCTLVVTLEPCAMCAAAISHFRMQRLVYGAYDPKGGAVDHGIRFFQRRSCLHVPDEIVSGVREREAAVLLKHFFQCRRKK